LINLAQNQSHNFVKLMEKDNQWQEEIALLKAIILKTGLTPKIKWGMEVYTALGYSTRMVPFMTT
jgi:hypothetical protein